MQLPDFGQFPLWGNFAIFASSAAIVWLAGTGVAHYADDIAHKTGVGHMAVGLVLLGGITSLPEIAVALFSAFTGNPVLSVNNLLGGVAMQKAVLAASDAIIGKDALTVVVSSPALLLQGALSILVLTVVAVAIVVRDTPILGIGAWSWCILALYLCTIWMLSKAEGRQPWRPSVDSPPRSGGTPASDSQKNISMRRLVGKTVVAAAFILAAGFLLSQTGDAIAEQTGLGQSFVGAVLLGLATSLPEISTVVSAMRLRQYEMAISDILGTNLFNVALIFLVDAVYPGGPVLNEVGNFSLFVSLIGILLTTTYLVGLIERRNLTVARMGLDSLATLIVYVAGLFLLYRMR
ncbi:sodium:calcium antiporter [Noviherbaspirillum sp. ST9]|uniref:sodium:calcium antiporter n=1 Tax=Noviherbaspirillum sp. ST9 TaxID=3401606 RepID=UPI003B5873E6